MSWLNDVVGDVPFVLFLTAFVCAVVSLVMGDWVLLAVGLACGVVGSIIEKKGVEND